MKKMLLALSALIATTLVVLAQGLPFPGPGAKTYGGGGGFTNTKSIKLASSSAYIVRTQGTGTSRRLMTFNFWVNSSDFTTSSVFYYIGTVNGSTDYFGVQNGAAGLVLGAVSAGLVTTGPVMGDNTWYQITLQLDTANATATDRCKIFINGAPQTLTFVAPITQNYDTGWGLNTADESNILDTAGNPQPLIDEFSRIDGQLLGPSSFANGSSLPIDISALTFGAQGWWTRFETGVASTVGNDYSGVGNNFTNSGFVNGDFSSSVP